MLNPNATVMLTVTRPDGSKETTKLTFDSSKYFGKFETNEIGKYKLEIEYTNGKDTYTESRTIDIPYSPEYDRFALFDPSALYSAIRDRGTVTEEAAPTIEVDKNRLETYTISFALPFMILAIVLYIADLIVRKLRWRDIVSLVNKFKNKFMKVRS